MAIRDEDLDRLAAGATDPTDLVRRSFAFLLEREPKEAILRSFDLPIIGRFFPEYEATIRFGVALGTKGQPLRAHAWLECNDQVVIGGEVMADFTPLAA